MKKSGGTLTHLHMAKWPPQQIPYLNFLGADRIDTNLNCNSAPHIESYIALKARKLKRGICSTACHFAVTYGREFYRTSRVFLDLGSAQSLSVCICQRMITKLD